MVPILHICENLVPIFHIVLALLHVINYKNVEFEHNFCTPKIIEIDRT